MFLNKLKIAGVVLLATTLTLTGTSVVTHRVLAGGRPAAPNQSALVLSAAAEKDAKGPTATSPDGRLVATGNDKAVALIDAASQKEIRRLAGHRDRVTAVAFSPDGKTLVTGGADKSVMLWDLPTGNLLWKSQGKEAVRSLTFARDGRTVLVQEGANGKRTLEAATGREARPPNP